MKISSSGFTIVELLVVIVVIAILAVVSVVSYQDLAERSRASVLESNLSQAKRKLSYHKALHGEYPEDLTEVQISDTNQIVYSYAKEDDSYCLAASIGNTSYSTSEEASFSPGSCTLFGSVNVALGKSVSGTAGTTNISRITDGNKNTNSFYGVDRGAQTASQPDSVTVDLGSPTRIGRVIVWRYYGGGRISLNTRTEVSADGSQWQTIFDSNVSGTYPESSAGKAITFSPKTIRYIRDTMQGNSVNGSNIWVEIEAY